MKEEQLEGDNCGSDLDDHFNTLKIRRNRFKKKKGKKLKKKLVNLKQEVISIGRIKFTQAQTMVTDTNNQNHFYPIHHSLFLQAE